MYKIEKYKWDDRGKIFFSSDFHIFHNPKEWPSPIWEMRGYTSVEDASENTLRVINERVGKDDILYFLGDGFLNAEDQQVLDWLARVNCQNIKYLWGNHESVPYRLYKKQFWTNMV